MVYRLIFNNTEERRCSLSRGRGARASVRFGPGAVSNWVMDCIWILVARMSERVDGMQWQRSERLWLRARAAERRREREVIGSSD